MKRCPQCEFIYEDDQSLCDMDGVLLVFDSRTLPNFHALETVPALPGKASRRNRMVPAFATLLLMLVIASFYYVSGQRPAPPPNLSPPSLTGTTAVEAPVPAPPAPPIEAPASVPPATEPEKSEAQPTAPAKPAAALPARKATATKPTAVKPAEPKKADSKVGSILKKTGRILKKPFKF